MLPKVTVSVLSPFEIVIVYDNSKNLEEEKRLAREEKEKQKKMKKQ